MIAATEQIDRLRDRIRRLERGCRATGTETISTGWKPLDRLLPERGLRRGSLVEWLEDGPGSGAATLALGAAREACRDGGGLVVIDRFRQVYPPALAGWGWNLQRVVFVHPANRRDEAWCWDQALGCAAVGAVWGGLEQVDDRLFRRWQLTAEGSGVLGLLVRPAAFRLCPSWADVRLLVQPRPALAAGQAAGRSPPAGLWGRGEAKGREAIEDVRNGGERGWRIRVQLCRSRGAAGGRVEFELEAGTGRLRTAGQRTAGQRDESYSRNLAARLAGPATDARSPGTRRASRDAG